MILQVPGPSDCFLTGLCGVARDQVGPPPGLMFLGLGLVALGVAILVTERRRRDLPGRASTRPDAPRSVPAADERGRPPGS